MLALACLIEKILGIQGEFLEKMMMMMMMVMMMMVVNGYYIMVIL